MYIMIQVAMNLGNKYSFVMLLINMCYSSI